MPPMRMHNLLAVLILFTISACLGTGYAVDNDVDAHGFVGPVLLPLGDASIAVGDIVWRSADGAIWVVQAKSPTVVTLVDPRSPGFARTLAVSAAAERVVKVPHITIDVPGAPVSTASTP